MSFDVDERLLQFAPFYKKMFLGRNPDVKEVSDQMIEEELLKSLVEFGYAKRIEQPNGNVRFEATPEFLNYLARGA